ncbi:lipopolysaccharide biosynthesis protein [Rhodococcoides kyotonense]|uniref:Membrane protein involved in the export of O-antigen and teichoic acid n=1 Tax=Rhodococcoides kyotonense TaxID=398843 RepID=A0A239MDL5_9NOCA|nr:oligosaccharide flippase family protein [Rhodococcus kyotonensis]SNT40580.1 Membrane protein involved in the export of O-antigen and teichoic acid [Rhodococcus kyotonensis]
MRNLVLRAKGTRLSRTLVNTVSSPAGLLVGRVVASGTAVITSPIIARAIGADGRGLVAASMTVLTVLPIALALGLPWAVRRRCAVDPANRMPVMRTSFILSLVSVIPAGAMGLALTHSILASLPPAGKVWLMVGLLLTPLIVSRNCLYSVLVIEDRFRALFFATVSQPIANLTVLTLLYLSGALTVASAIASTSVSVLVSFLITSRLNDIRLRGPKVPVGGLLREAIKSAGAQISEIASYRLNQLILLPIIGSAALGNYAVALNIALAPVPVGQALGTATFKKSATLDTEGRKAIVQESLRAAVSTGFLLMSIIAILAPWVIPFVFGSQFERSVPVTLILCIGALFVIANYTLTSNMIAQDRSHRASIAQYAGFSLGLVATVSLGHFFGLIGATVGSVLGFVTTSVTATLLLKVPLRAWIPTFAGVKCAGALLRGKTMQNRSSFSEG